MPELPEVETIVRALHPLVKGRIFLSLQVHEPRSANLNPCQLREILQNPEVVNLFRRGKYICFQLANQSHLTVHLRMTGKILEKLTEKDKKYLRVTFHFDHGFELYFVDVRKFGRVEFWPGNQPLLPALGPEPLQPEIVFQVLRQLDSVRAMKTVLLDQRVLAGVGNIYADEVLFRAGIHPAHPVSLLKESQLQLLSQELPRILLQAINNKGTTISDYRTPDAGPGGHQEFLKVYGREGQTCYSCGSTILRIKINGRSSHFCPGCQGALLYRTTPGSPTMTS